MIILLIALMGVTFSYVSELREKQISEKTEDAAELYSFDFSASECQDYIENDDLGILQIEWLNDNECRIKAKAVLNCAEDIIGGSFSINNTTETITLDYTILSGEFIPDCECLYDLNYMITIPKNGYDFDLIQVNTTAW